MKIPFSKISFGKEEKKAINDIIKSGWVVQGPKVQEFEEKFSEYVGSNHAVFVDSCTAALFLATKWYADETVKVISVPAFTFTSTAEVVVNNQKYLVFKDIDVDTFCADADITVNLFGRKSPYNAHIVDSAHRIERGDMIDANGIWCYSFYATKNMSTVNGGMICTNDDLAAEWFRKARDHGISQGTMERYQQGKWDYDIEFVGWRLKADDLRAAIGLEQLKKLDDFNEKRNNIVNRYNANLSLDRKGNHVYPIFVHERAKFIEILAENGIQVSVHYPKALHKMVGYAQYHDGTSLPNAEWIADHCVSLPIFPGLKANEVEYICKKVEQTKLLINK